MPAAPKNVRLGATSCCAVPSPSRSARSASGAVPEASTNEAEEADKIDGGSIKEEEMIDALKLVEKGKGCKR